MDELDAFNKIIGALPNGFAFSDEIHIIKKRLKNNCNNCEIMQVFINQISFWCEEIKKDPDNINNIIFEMESLTKK